MLTHEFAPRSVNQFVAINVGESVIRINCEGDQTCDKRSRTLGASTNMTLITSAAAMSPMYAELYSSTRHTRCG